MREASRRRAGSRPSSRSTSSIRWRCAATQAGVEVHLVSEDVIRHLTSTVTPQGLVGSRPFVDVGLDEALGRVRGRRGAAVLLHEVRDPGNAGTVLRSADAAGAGGVVFTETSVDVYNPKTVRASAGSVFHLPVVRGVETACRDRARRERGGLEDPWRWPPTATSTCTGLDLCGTGRLRVRQRGARVCRPRSLERADAVVRVPASGTRRVAEPRRGGDGLPLRVAASAAAGRPRRSRPSSRPRPTTSDRRSPR